MGLIEVKNLTQQFGSKVLYKESNFEIFRGEHVGLVGQNGSGKTTLLNSIIGKLIPDSGQIKWQKNIKYDYLDQHAVLDKELKIIEYLKTAFDELYKIEEKLEKIYLEIGESYNDSIAKKISDYQETLDKKGFYEIDAKIQKTASGLGITALGLDSKLGNLSGGQRAKVILAKLLLREADVLLLDEPTNFLDVEHIAWLGAFLKGFKGAFIVISHDFEFLNEITTCILDIEFQKITKYTGNFTIFLNTKGIRRETYERQFSAQQKEIKKLEDFISKNRARASTAKRAQSRIKTLDKIQRLAPPKTTSKPKFNLISLPLDNNKTLLVKNLEIGYNKPLLAPINLTLNPREKIVLTGFNGIGKSTFLKTILGQIPALFGSFKFAPGIKIGYFEQDINWKDKTLKPIEVVKNHYQSLTEREIRQNLANCGVHAKNVMQPISTLSGGEQTKVKLCLLSLEKSNLLILDEPTNHLDADSKGSLSEELKNWKGSLILVSHEESFYESWIDRKIEVSNVYKKFNASR